MLALGSVRPLILESVTSHQTDYDLTGFLQTVVLADLNQNGTGRTLSQCLIASCLLICSLSTLIFFPSIVQCRDTAVNFWVNHHVSPTQSQRPLVSYSVFRDDIVNLSVFILYVYLAHCKLLVMMLIFRYFLFPDLHLWLHLPFSSLPLSTFGLLSVGLHRSGKSQSSSYCL